MGVEIRPATINGENHSDNGNIGAPVVLGLHPFALVDHAAKVDWSLLSQIPGERGGSFPVAVEELKHILNELNAHILPSADNESLLKTIAGGSVANTIRGLAAGFGISSVIIGACCEDEEGKLFMSDMGFYKVDLSRLRLKKGTTAQCVCLVDEVGDCTIRPCLSGSVKVQAAELKREDIKGSKWLVLRYAILNIEVIKEAIKIAKEEGLFVLLHLARFEMVRKFKSPLFELLESGNIDLCFANKDDARLVLRYAILNIEVIKEAIKIAKEEGLFVLLDLARFEMVRKFKSPLFELLESGNIDLCFANKDDATELLRGEEKADPDAALEYLAKHFKWAVVTLAQNGCIARHEKEFVRVEKEFVHVPAIREAKVTNATGAGDLFASGFLYGLVRGLSLEECCQVGSCSGGSGIRSLGGEVTPENWQWMVQTNADQGTPTSIAKQILCCDIEE